MLNSANMKHFFRHFAIPTILLALLILLTACNDNGENSHKKGKKAKHTSLLVHNGDLSFNKNMASFTGLPRIVIETENNIPIKDKKTKLPALMQVFDENGPASQVMGITIKGRGNVTWKMPKKPYLVKFEDEYALLGMKSASKWVFLANSMDHSLIRNAVAFEIAKKTKLKWTPSGKFVDLILNKKPAGNYFVCEKIEIGKNRLDIPKDSYLLEIDINFDEDYKFRTTRRNLPVNLHNPSKPTEEQFQYIQAYVDTVECILYGDCKNLDIEDYLDLQSFADFWIVNELTQNDDISNPRSVFLYKDKGKLTAGPVWDFDWETFRTGKHNWRNEKCVWYKPLLTNEGFRKILKKSWSNYRSDFEKIHNTINALAVYLEESSRKNTVIWGQSETNAHFYDKKYSFEESIAAMKKAYSARLVELDSLFNAL